MMGGSMRTNMRYTQCGRRRKKSVKMTRGYAMTTRVLWLLLLLVVVGGCTNGPQSTLDVSGPVARMQRDVFLVTVVVCTGIFLATGGLLV